MLQISGLLDRNSLEEYVNEKILDGTTTRFDAVVSYMVDNGLEPNEIKPLLKGNLLEYIKTECLELNLIKGNKYNLDVLFL